LSSRPSNYSEIALGHRKSWAVSAVGAFSS
jgi:hypothetical protein